MFLVDFSPTPVRPWPCPRMIYLGLGLVLGWLALSSASLYGQSLALTLASLVRTCPWPCPRLARPRHNTVRYLDSNSINFKTFAFLAVYWPFWTSLYNTDIIGQPFLNQAPTMLNNVLHFRTCSHVQKESTVFFFFILKLIDSWARSS